MAYSADQTKNGQSSGTAEAASGFHTLFEHSPAATLLLDPTGGILLGNIAAATVLGMGDDGIPARANFTNLADAIDGSELRGVLTEIADEKVSSHTCVLRIGAARDIAFLATGIFSRTEWHGEPAVLCVLTRGGNAALSVAADPGSSSTERLPVTDAIESISEGFALFDADRVLVLCNDVYRTKIWPELADFIRPGLMFDDIVRETIKRNIWEASGVDPDTLLESAVARHSDVPSLHEIQYPDGRCIQQIKRPTADGGIIAVYSDLTEFKQREANLSETQDRYLRLLETLPDGVVIHSGGKLAYANPTVVAIYGGRSHTDLIGRNSADLVPPEEREQSIGRLDKVRRDRTSLPPVEERRITLDGRLVNVEVRDAFIQWNGKPAVLSVIRDLTERKRAEFVLRESERRYLTVASNLPGAVYQRVMLADGSISFPYVSPGVLETHGIDADTVKKGGNLLVRSIHPDDRERFARTLRASAQNLTPFDIEVRNIKPDGQIVWIRSVARTHRRDDDAIVWDGIFVDITARKQAEERAAQTYRWLTEAIESLSDGFVLWDSDDRLVLWNDRFLEGHPQRDELVKVGITFTEMIEASATSMRRRFGDAETEEWLAERMRQHSEAQGSYEMMTSMGKWLLVTERRTHEGYTVSIYTDITEAKRAADELKESEERYRRLVQMSPDAILVHIEDRIVFANDTAAEVLAANSVDDLLGQDILDFAHPEDRVKIVNRRNQIVDGQSSSFLRVRYLRADGRAFQCESAVSRIAWEGEEAVLVVLRDIEDRVIAEQQQALFATVTQQAVDSIEIADNETVLQYVNPAFEKMTGYSSDEAIGKTPGSFLRPAVSDPGFYDEIDRTVIGGEPWTGTYLARRKDGSEFHLEATISPVFDAGGSLTHFVAIKRDITERMRTEAALRDSEERYRKLLALTPDAIYVQVDSNIVLANEAAVQMFKAEGEEDLIGRSIYDTIHPEFRDFVRKNEERVNSKEVDTLRAENRRIRFDGSDFWASVSITPLNWKGEQGALVIVRDITDQRDASEALREARDSAEVANLDKSKFLAGVSHGLRTPLNAIIGFSEVMTKNEFSRLGSDAVGEYASNIHESGLRLLGVVNDILDLSRADAGDLALSPVDLDLPALLDTVLNDVETVAGAGGARIDTRIAADLPHIHGDRRMVERMVANLLSNAVAYATGQSSVRMTAHRAADDSVSIAVVDTGTEIEADGLRRIAEPFAESESSPAGNRRGSDLSLALVRSYAELHGGSLRVWSRRGIGTRSAIRLPIEARPTS